MGRHWQNEWLTPSGCLLLAMGLLILPLRWLLAWLVAVAVHEGCHLAAVILCGGRVDAFRLDAGGASMVANDLTSAQEIFCVLAGPIGAVILLLPWIRWIPATAVCAVLQSACNLLPLVFLDGGRAVRCVLEMWMMEQKADIISRSIHNICISAIAAFGIYAALWLKLGLMPVILSLWCAVRGNFVKIPCKEGHPAVQ